MNARTASGCAYAGLVLLGIAAALRVPEDLVQGDSRSLMFPAYFIAAAWVAAIVLPRPLRLTAVLGVTAVLAALAMDAAITTFGLKESYAGLRAMNWQTGRMFEGPAGPYELGVFMLSAILLFAALWLKSDATRFDPPAAARAMLICLGAIVALSIVAYLTPLKAFIMPLGVVLRSYLGPLMASAVVVLIWDFITKLKPLSGSSDA